MPIQETEAVLIRSYPLSESSVIGVFYTRDFGKVRAVARGMRGPKSKFRGQLDLLNPFGSVLPCVSCDILPQRFMHGWGQPADSPSEKRYRSGYIGCASLDYAPNGHSLFSS